jgi:acetoacetate decarboxylase
MKKDNSKRGGNMSVLGWRPGDPPKMRFDVPFYQNCRIIMFSYLTTREAVEAVLPEPLEPGPQPFVAFCAQEFPAFNSIDGVKHNYKEMTIFVECQYKGEVALNIPFMYVGPSTGDYTDSTDVAIAMGRESRGFPKKAGNIFINKEGDEWVATLKRRGVQLVDFRAKLDEKATPAEIPTQKYKRLLLVKEIISSDFTGYDVRKLIGMEADYLGNVAEITSCMKGTSTLKLGHIDGDPLDTLKIVKPGMTVDFTQNIRIPVGAAPPEILASNWE